MKVTWSSAGGSFKSMSLKSKVQRGLTWLPQAMRTQLGPSRATRPRWVHVRERTARRNCSWDLHRGRYIQRTLWSRRIYSGTSL